jgi:hypothetical protein
LFNFNSIFKVPWVTVNGKHSSTDENAILNDMVDYVCTNYKGSVKIAACTGHVRKMNSKPRHVCINEFYAPRFL